jgi:hypothetical protein
VIRVTNWKHVMRVCSLEMEHEGVQEHFIVERETSCEGSIEGVQRRSRAFVVSRKIERSLSLGSTQNQVRVGHLPFQILNAFPR